MKRCLFCYEELDEADFDMHPRCSRTLFGQPNVPDLDYTDADIEELAHDVVQTKVSLTGVQAKLSLHLSAEKKSSTAKRLTIVGVWGSYILKPPTAHYAQLPEVEDLCMHLAEDVGIVTVPHSLIHLANGTKAYITRRIDRVLQTKLAMEDMCQLTDRLTEEKYYGSYEQIAKALRSYSATPGLDVVNFYELVLCSFLCGNADMHLKNFSLIEKPGLGMTLSPAYDLINTALVNPADTEDLALSLNGKKRNLTRKDFIQAMTNSRLDPRQQDNIFEKLRSVLPIWKQTIDKSFLDPAFKVAFQCIVQQRVDRLFH